MWEGPGKDGGSAGKQLGKGRQPAYMVTRYRSTRVGRRKSSEGALGALYHIVRRVSSQCHKTLILVHVNECTLGLNLHANLFRLEPNSCVTPAEYWKTGHGVFSRPRKSTKLIHSPFLPSPGKDGSSAASGDPRC